MKSSLEIIDIATRHHRVVYRTAELIEAPNWLAARPGADEALIFNGGGRLYRIALTPDATPQAIATGFATRCNNDHGVSPDGRQLVISDQTHDGQSRIYTLPVEGGAPTLVTPAAPSYWHGWSPDGSTLAYCAHRDGAWGIFTVPAAGGAEQRLTRCDGLDDGPDYSPDGRWIYFNSDRSGRMQIWRMQADGSELRQVTSGGHNDWFAHPSPDGRWVVMLSYAADVSGHPPDKQVSLRLAAVTPEGLSAPTVLTDLFGGQGTINVPSWSPDSRELAYVRYGASGVFA